MKTKVLMIALVVVLFNNAQAQVPSYVPTNGLVGWWPFNGNANDESGNGNNGVAYGPSQINDRFGTPNKAFHFDGLQNYCTLPPMFDNGVNEFTISLWFNSDVNQTGTFSDIILQDANVNNGSLPANSFDLRYYQGSSVFRCELGLNNPNPTPILPAIPASLVWHNAVMVKSSAGFSLFIDGTMIQTILGSGIYSSYQQNIYIGNINFPSYPLTNGYTGSIDDIGIWNRALTQQEIANLYNSSAYVPCASPAFPANLANGLVGYWPFCGDANDESGNGNNGTVNGATLTSDRFGNPNSAYDFDGVNDYINCGHISALDGISSATISAWFNYNSIVNASRIFTQELVSNSSNGFGLCISDFYAPNTIQGITRNGQNTVQYSSSFLQPNTYYHVVFVFDGNAANNNQKVKMYVNGSLLSLNYVGAIPSALPINNYEAWIGGQFNVPSGPTSAPFNGVIDDIAIWNRALNASEVQQLYNTGIYFQTVTGSCDTLQFNANITGFNPVTYQNQVKVFPNPAKDNLVIDCGANYNTLNGYSIKIVNTLSQTVYNSPITQQITNIQLIAPTWSNGAYVVQFINPSGTVIEAKQIIIQ